MQLSTAQRKAQRADRKPYLAGSEGLLRVPKLSWYKFGEAVHCSRAWCLWKDQSVGCKAYFPGYWHGEGKLTATDVFVHIAPLDTFFSVSA